MSVMDCPKCGSKAFWRHGREFDHERKCGSCGHCFEPGGPQTTLAAHLPGIEEIVRQEAPKTPDVAKVVVEGMVECDRCDGDGKAHGSDRPFEWSGPGTYPGDCPKCGGAGVLDRGSPLTPDGAKLAAMRQWIEAKAASFDASPRPWVADVLRELLEG